MTNSAYCTKNYEAEPEIKVYKRRWFLLILFLFYEITTGLHWVQLSTIADIISKLYNVSSTTVQSSTIVFSVELLLLTLPCLYLQNKVGSRCFIILAGLSTLIGSYIKVFTSQMDIFWPTMIGHMFNGFPYAFTCCILARFVAVWFPNHEISRACAIAVMGDTFSGALSFLFPNLLVKIEEDQNFDHDAIKNDLFWMQVTYAGAITTSFVLIFLFFRNAPPLPPSRAQALRHCEADVNMTKTIKKVLTNWPFMVTVCVPYSLVITCYQVIATYLNSFVNKNFHDSNATGQIGFMFTVTGMIGSIVMGCILDKYKKFKEMSIFLIVASSLSVLLMAFTLDLENIWYFYGATSIMGFFTMGMYATGSQLGIETTYPLSEEAVYAIMQISAQIFVSITAAIFGKAIEYYTHTSCLVGLAALQLVGVFLGCLVPSKRNRQIVEESHNLNECGSFVSDRTNKPIIVIQHCN